MSVHQQRTGPNGDAGALVRSVREADAAVVKCLAAAGLGPGEVQEWLNTEPGELTDFASDRDRFSHYWQKMARLVARLPVKPKRNEAEQEAAADRKSVV